MSAFKKFKPGERAHITIIGETSERGQILECGICKGRWSPTDAARGRKRFSKMHWMVQHVKCATEPRHGEAFECPVSEARGIGHFKDERSMPRTSHTLDRQVRHFPYKVARDGRDYGRSEAIKDGARRRRQIGRAFCEEWTEENDNGR